MLLLKYTCVITLLLLFPLRTQAQVAILPDVFAIVPDSIHLEGRSICTKAKKDTALWIIPGTVLEKVVVIGENVLTRPQSNYSSKICLLVPRESFDNWPKDDLELQEVVVTAYHDVVNRPISFSVAAMPVSFSLEDDFKFSRSLNAGLAVGFPRLTSKNLRNVIPVLYTGLVTDFQDEADLNSGIGLILLSNYQRTFGVKFLTSWNHRTGDQLLSAGITWNFRL